MREVNIISATELDQLVSSRNAMIFDLRDHQLFRCGHIDKAINLAEANLKMLLDNVNKSLPVIVYCSNGELSIGLVEVFLDFGFAECYSLAGGYEAWIDLQQQNQGMREDLCRWLERNGYDCKQLSARVYNGETALMFAARQGETEYVIELIERGADIELCNNDGNSAVWLACYSGNPYTLDVLIQAGANLNRQNVNGATPIIYAASAGRYEMVKILALAGADISLKTLDDFTAIDVASTLGILKLLRKTLKQGVEATVEPQHRKLVLC